MSCDESRDSFRFGYTQNELAGGLLWVDSDPAVLGLEDRQNGQPAEGLIMGCLSPHGLRLGRQDTVWEGSFSQVIMPRKADGAWSPRQRSNIS